MDMMNCVQEILSSKFLFVFGVIGLTLIGHYRETSSISRTKSQSLNISCIVAQLCSLNSLKPGVKLRMKM